MADWTPEEAEAIVADYFAMWNKDLRGLAYNKADHNRKLREIIPNRNRSAVEQKHRNISAVLWHLGFPYLRGYKPLPNYQTLLRNIVESRLLVEKQLIGIISSEVLTPESNLRTAYDFRETRVAPPQRKLVKKLVTEESRKRTSFLPRNYLEIEARNQSLGQAGEKFVLSFERYRLIKAGKDDLANRVEHVSVTQGDYLGYDIQSFEVDGRDRLIEVKTTRYGAMNRFFASLNEVEISHRKKDVYRLYRVFNFDKQPQFFVLAGSLHDTCQLTAINFSAIPHKN